MGWMGQRTANEEEFFTPMQRVRAALGTRQPSVNTSKAVKDFIEESRLPSEAEQLQIMAVLATRLASEQA